MVSPDLPAITLLCSAAFPADQQTHRSPLAAKTGMSRVDLWDSVDMRGRHPTRSCSMKALRKCHYGRPSKSCLCAADCGKISILCKTKLRAVQQFGFEIRLGTKVEGSNPVQLQFRAFKFAWTVLCGNPASRAKVRTVQRPWDFGCWQARVCTFCQTGRGASRSPSSPCSARERRHLPTVTSGMARSNAVC